MTATVSRHNSAAAAWQGLDRGWVRIGRRILELRELLASPAIAIALGVLVGIGLLAPLIWASRFFSADQVNAGLAVVMGSVFAGLLGSLGLLFGYRALAPEGLVWFGPSLVGGFVVGLGVFALRVATTWFKSDDGKRG